MIVVELRANSRMRGLTSLESATYTSPVLPRVKVALEPPTLRGVPVPLRVIVELRANRLLTAPEAPAAIVMAPALMA